jgi:hypothetical protein
MLSSPLTSPVWKLPAGEVPSPSSSLKDNKITGFLPFWKSGFHKNRKYAFEPVAVAKNPV